MNGVPATERKTVKMPLLALIALTTIPVCSQEKDKDDVGTLHVQEISCDDDGCLGDVHFTIDGGRGGDGRIMCSWSVGDCRPLQKNGDYGFAVVPDGILRHKYQRAGYQIPLMVFSLAKDPGPFHSAVYESVPKR